MTSDPERARVVAWAEARLAEAAADSRVLLLVLPAPTVDPVLLWDDGNRRPTVFWQPSNDSAWVGIGMAHTLEAHGTERYQHLLESAAKFRSVSVSWSALAGANLRWLGGFAFAPDQCGQPPWLGFGDARFILPRFLYEENEARLILATQQQERLHEEQRRMWGRELESLLGWMESLVGRRAEGQGSGPAFRSTQQSSADACNGLQRRPSSTDESDYLERVEAIRGAIARGAMNKVVAARRVVLALPSLPCLSTVLQALREPGHHSAVFAFRFGEECFLGASPERLVQRIGNVVRSEAVAGSASAQIATCKMELWGSAKNRLEHQLVVDDLSDRLRPLCEELSVPFAPAFKRLDHVLHLATPIRGHLNKRVHVLDLVRHLHPSPAVGGVPAARAQEWILAHEPDARGWYSGPVGWFDGHGDGDFSVALRSGVLIERRAYLYSGAGILQESVASDELEETELKLGTLTGALQAALS
ncbi:isochorismate synthase MenF [Myxococcota bacterium]